MLKRLLTLGAIMLIASTSIWAQVDLESVIRNIQLEKTAQAETELKGFETQEPKNIDEVYYWLGYIKLIGESYGEAETYFKKGIEKKKKSAANYAGLARVRLKENKLSDATELLSTAEEIAGNPKKAEQLEGTFQWLEALLEGTAEMRKQARAKLYDLQPKFPGTSRPGLLLGTYYKKQNVPGLAIEELEKVIDKDPNFVPALEFLAELYYDKGKESKDGADFQKGLDYANKAIELDAEYAPAYRIRAELYLLAKQYERARNDMEKYVKQTEGDLKARVRFASFLFLSNEFEEALKELESIEKAGLKTNVMRRLKGLSLLQLGRLDEAKAAMDDYFENVKREEYIIFQDYEAYGDIFREMGDLEKADENYVKMIGKSTDRSAKFTELSDMYSKESKRRLAESRKLRGEAKALNDPIQAAFAERNEAARMGDSIKTQELDAKMAELQQQGKDLIKQSKEVAAGANEFYPLEAHYRQLVVDYQEKKSLQNYYKLALAEYRTGLIDIKKDTANTMMLEKADENFVKCHGLKDDYVNPYNYRFRVAQKLEAANGESNSWLVIKPVEDYLKVFEQRDFASLDKGAKRLLLSSLEIMAAYKFNPQNSTNPDDLNCAEGMPYVDRVYELDPSYGSESLKSIKDYCEQAGNR
ncbi:MAG: hypothetical protein AAFU33_11715 [Bacteroidota bacterium]